MIGYFTTLAVASILGLVMSGPTGDIVYKMPWIEDGDQPGFNLWSGYISIFGSSKMIHYFFVESANDPVNDPLVIWYNGGPGCSSMLGFMQEHGPFLWETGKSNWTGNNPHSWNQKANMLYIEQPAGVGYSYFDDPNDIGFKFTDYNAA
jgi:carboxypeptidase C (cathepsin A)